MGPVCRLEWVHRPAPRTRCSPQDRSGTCPEPTRQDACSTYAGSSPTHHMQHASTLAQHAAHSPEYALRVVCVASLGYVPYMVICQTGPIWQIQLVAQVLQAVCSPDWPHMLHTECTGFSLLWHTVHRAWSTYCMWHLHQIGSMCLIWCWICGPNIDLSWIQHAGLASVCPRLAPCCVQPALDVFCLPHAACGARPSACYITAGSTVDWLIQLYILDSDF